MLLKYKGRADIIVYDIRGVKQTIHPEDIIDGDKFIEARGIDSFIETSLEDSIEEAKSKYRKTIEHNDVKTQIDDQRQEINDLRSIVAKLCSDMDQLRVEFNKTKDEVTSTPQEVVIEEKVKEEVTTPELTTKPEPKKGKRNGESVI